ncbi:MAG: hypothetical protein V3S14_02475 [Anaerolineae bacterium]
MGEFPSLLDDVQQLGLYIWGQRIIVQRVWTIYVHLQTVTLPQLVQILHQGLPKIEWHCGACCANPQNVLAHLVVGFMGNTLQL